MIERCSKHRNNNMQKIYFERSLDRWGIADRRAKIWPFSLAFLCWHNFWLLTYDLHYFELSCLNVFANKHSIYCFRSCIYFMHKLTSINILFIIPYSKLITFWENISDKCFFTYAGDNCESVCAWFIGGILQSIPTRRLLSGCPWFLHQRRSKSRSRSQTKTSPKLEN